MPLLGPSPAALATLTTRSSAPRGTDHTWAIDHPNVERPWRRAIWPWSQTPPATVYCPPPRAGHEGPGHKPRPRHGLLSTPLGTTRGPWTQTPPLTRSTVHPPGQDTRALDTNPAPDTVYCPPPRAGHEGPGHKPRPRHGLLSTPPGRTRGPWTQTPPQTRSTVHPPRQDTRALDTNPAPDTVYCPPPQAGHEGPGHKPRPRHGLLSTPPVRTRGPWTQTPPQTRSTVHPPKQGAGGPWSLHPAPGTVLTTPTGARSPEEVGQCRACARTVSMVAMIETLSSRGMKGLSRSPSRRQRATSSAS